MKRSAGGRVAWREPRVVSTWYGGGGRGWGVHARRMRNELGGKLAPSHRRRRRRAVFFSFFLLVCGCSSLGAAQPRIGRRAQRRVASWGLVWRRGEGGANAPPYAPVVETLYISAFAAPFFLSGSARLRLTPVSPPPPLLSCSCAAVYPAGSRAASVACAAVAACARVKAHGARHARWWAPAVSAHADAPARRRRRCHRYRRRGAAGRRRE